MAVMFVNESGQNGQSL